MSENKTRETETQRLLGIWKKVEENSWSQQFYEGRYGDNEGICSDVLALLAEEEEVTEFLVDDFALENKSRRKIEDDLEDWIDDLSFETEDTVLDEYIDNFKNSIFDDVDSQISYYKSRGS